jgi:hypothetical protein
VPVSVLAARRPALRPLAALLWHQTEEWVWPGSFLPWINRTVLGSDDDEFPIDRPLGFMINVGFGWGLSLAALAGARGAAPTTALYVSHIGNAGLHLSWAVCNKRYNPGTISSVLTLLPVATDGLRKLAADPDVSPRAMQAGVAGGIAIATLLMPALKLRMRLRAGG